MEPYLAKLRSIQQLDLSMNEFSDDGAVSLGPHLANLTSIRELDLSDNIIGDEGAKSLGPHLANLKFIQKLNLSDNDIGDASESCLLQSCPRNFMLSRSSNSRWLLLCS